MLAPGERLGVFDIAHPGLQYEIVAPGDRALSIDGVLATLGKNGFTGVIGAARKGATEVVIDESGRVQLKAAALSMAPPPGEASQIFLKSGMIVLDRGKVSIYADQLPQPGKPAAMLQTSGVVDPALNSIVPNLVNGLNPSRIIAPASGGLSLASNSTPQVAPQIVAPAAPNYFA